ncbi:putative MPP superfamily phosphohydrolase [Oikeobacillus pervagus]|uniref:MPP superfamily phosphohydrolase n=1 Tax=Oikeobacillus pervagus TaxID=1325931 RepID=A0AAJ1T2P6_9BACI|nr:metallophosphoesterase [Oikeobacillus pervagus]MDQ0214824.1 putative MPP superfamily phosphohydrolase [Oikeobacillus pervagus]
MKKKISRRSFFKKIAFSSLTLFSLSYGGYFYARFIEPRRLDITEIEIEHTLIPPSFQGMKILQFSDTHIGFQYDPAMLLNHVETINSLQPDIVLFTGDLLDEPNQYDDIEKIISILKMIKAPFGKFAIYGNHDHGGYGTDIYERVMRNSGFTLLKNESKVISMIDQSKIYIAGVDDLILGKPDIHATLRSIPNEQFTILLAHEPDFANQLPKHRIHLQLSGHSHGGQIRLPFIGALYTPPYAEKYQDGQYYIPLQKMTLYVNRGIGTTRLPFRFLAVPEITIFTLTSKTSP